MLLCATAYFFPTLLHWPHFGSLKSAIVEIFTPTTLANVTNQVPLSSILFNIYRYTIAWNMLFKDVKN